MVDVSIAPLHYFTFLRKSLFTIYISVIISKYFFIICRCSSLPVTTCTEVAQSWGKLAVSKSTEYYSSKPLKDLCCIKKKHPSSFEIDTELKTKLFGILLECKKNFNVRKNILSPHILFMIYIYGIWKVKTKLTCFLI